NVMLIHVEMVGGNCRTAGKGRSWSRCPHTADAACLQSVQSGRTSCVHARGASRIALPAAAFRWQCQCTPAVFSMCSIMLNFSNVQMSPRREPDRLAVPQATVVAQFRDYHPEKFSGQGDPRVVDEWVQALEMIFEVMDCPERYRVLCAQIQLTGDARLWWNAYWGMRPGDKEGCTWDRFKELIREKYYPAYYRAEMERQFMSLQQGTRTVDEYAREFTRLGAF
ncbi:Unknown protein, partial [Striga hermonthica]